MQRVLITGSNRGIGLGLVRRSLQRGDRVFATCRHPEKAPDLNILQEHYTDHLTVLPLDVNHSAAIESTVAVIKGFTDGLDTLFNNAGIGVNDDQLGRITEPDIITAFKVNALAPLMLSQALIPLLNRGHRPVIANITSRMGSIADNTSGGYYSYRASKAALNMITRSLALDLVDRGIIAVVIHPGWVRTDMGGRKAPLQPDKSAQGILKVVDSLTPSDSGRFWAWDGKEIPW